LPSIGPHLQTVYVGVREGALRLLAVKVAVSCDSDGKSAKHRKAQSHQAA
jgi:hypothetical protein